MVEELQEKLMAPSPITILDYVHLDFSLKEKRNSGVVVTSVRLNFADFFPHPYLRHKLPSTQNSEEIYFRVYFKISAISNGKG